MVLINESAQNDRVARALTAEESSMRLRAVMALGSKPDAAYAVMLIERCAVEPDFFVRDMLSWAVAQLPSEVTLPLIRQELYSAHDQARSQALHTLSKIADPSTYAWITRDMLRDPDDTIAMTAWRAAGVLVEDGDKPALVEELVRHLGRGDESVQRSLSRTLVNLGEVITPALEKAARDPHPAVARHASEVLRQRPPLGFDAALGTQTRGARLGAREDLRDEATDPAS